MSHKQANPFVIPFLKWAGGKRWLVDAYSHLLAAEFDRYIEPFLGSAAVYFHLRPTAAILADANAELIQTYEQIQLNWEKVKKALEVHQRKHNHLYYYAERQRKHRTAHNSAAQFIYLNRVCWNGLYRVNRKGEFNVPLGTRTSVVRPTDDFRSAALQLQNAALLVSDFEPVLSQATDRDFVFVDPPYVTRHNLNGFLRYNDRIFRWSDQERLAICIRKAAERGTKILLTNADHTSISELYRGLGQQIELKRQSLLAAAPSNRSPTTEIALLINYEVRTNDGVA